MFNQSIKEIKNVVLYTRVSTEEQTKGFSLEAQLNDLTEYCKSKGYSVIAVYTDGGITGKSMDDRDELKKLLRHIKTDTTIDAIIIWRSTRIARNVQDFTKMIALFEQYDIALISITDKIDTSTPTGKYFSYMAAIFAEMEGNSIVIQAKNGMIQRAKNGWWNGGVVLGYDILDKKLIINDDEANTVKKIFKLYTEDCWGYNKITKYLNENIELYPTKKKSTWSYFTVKNIIDNPVYAGLIRWGVHTDWNKKRRQGKNSEYVLAEGKHEPIISKEVWNKALERRKQSTKEVIKTDQYTYLLSGLLTCPNCGASMTSHKVQKKKKNANDGKEYYRYYACNRWANKRICRPNLVYSKAIEEEVIRKIKEFVNNPNILNIIASQFQESLENIGEIDKSIKKLERRLYEKKDSERIYYGYLADQEKLKVLKEKMILSMIQAIANEISSLEIDLQSLKLKKEALCQHNTYFDGIVNILNNFSLAFDNAPHELKKRLLHSLIKEIKINPGEKPADRTISQIILHFNSTDLEAFSKTKVSKKINPEFEVTCDTVPP